MNDRKLKVLWENPNPNSAFAGQQIHLLSSDWDYLICQGNFFHTYTNSFGNKVTAFALKGYGFTLNASGNFNIGGNYNNVAAYMRLFDYVTDTRYDAKDTSVNVSVSPYSYSKQNTYLIPLVIYGGKF